MENINNNQSKVVDIAGKHLGKVGGEGYKSTYDPSLLVAIPRYFNRESYQIKEGSLPFIGYDVWNAYEVSLITTNGLPINGVLKIVYPADSPMHIESKSIKLYLNSFNMTPAGKNSTEAISTFEMVVSADLSKVLQTTVECRLHTTHKKSYNPHISSSWNTNNSRQVNGAKTTQYASATSATSVTSATLTTSYKTALPFNSHFYEPLGTKIDLDTIKFDTYKSDATQLQVDKNNEDGFLIVTSDLLRSNCRVTNQPDWGDIYIYLRGDKLPSLESLAKYIVSHREVSHFHEEICEMVFVHLQEAFNPSEILVGCLYTRRGGIDINPVRASHGHLIPQYFVDVNVLHNKTERQ